MAVRRQAMLKFGHGTNGLIVRRTAIDVAELEHAETKYD